jgi:hypothetical protein
MSTTKPPITEKDASLAQAQAGLRAKEAARNAPGGRQQVRALVHASTAAETENREPRTANRLFGYDLRTDDLLVTLCLTTYAEVFGTDPRLQIGDPKPRQRMLGLAVCGFLFTRPEEAWQILDAASDEDAAPEDRRLAKEEFRREAVALSGSMQKDEIEILTRHLLKLAGMQEPPAPDTDTPDAPGNAPSPAAEA